MTSLRVAACLATLVFFAGPVFLASSIANAESAEVPPPERPRVVILVSVTAPGGVAASYGSEGTDQISVRTMLAKALTERGFTLVSAAGEKVTRVASGEEAEVAGLADASASDLARKVGAGIALVAVLEGQSDGKIRGTAFTGGVAIGRAKLIDVGSGRVVDERRIEGAGWGNDENAAVERAFQDASGDAAQIIASRAAKAWPAEVASSGTRTAVKIRGARSWGSVSAIIRRLATTKGVSAVHPESVTGDEVRLALETSLSTSKLVSAIRNARLPNGSLSAKASSGAVSVSVRGD